MLGLPQVGAGGAVSLHVFPREQTTSALHSSVGSSPYSHRTPTSEHGVPGEGRALGQLGPRTGVLVGVTAGFDGPGWFEEGPFGFVDPVSPTCPPHAPNEVITPSRIEGMNASRRVIIVGA